MSIWLALPLVDLFSRSLETNSDADIDPTSSWWWQCWPKLSQGCWCKLLQGWWHDVLWGCWHNVDPKWSQTALHYCPKHVLATYHSVAIIMYTRWTQHLSHRSNRTHRIQSNWLGVRFLWEEESFALLNQCPESVGCLDPGCVSNASGTLQPRLYEGSLFDSNRLIHQQNVNPSETNTHSSQTLWVTSPVLLSTSRFFHTSWS